MLILDTFRKQTLQKMTEKMYNIKTLTIDVYCAPNRVWLPIIYTTFTST